MFEKITTLWNELDEHITVSKRELALSAAVCTLTGVIFGILISPKKVTSIGSHNSNTTLGSALPVEAPEDAVPADEEAAE